MVTSRRARRSRHGRPLRVTDGDFPGGAAPSDRLLAEVDAAIERLQDASPPDYRVEIRELPPSDVVSAAGPSEVSGGSMLGTYRVDADSVVIVLYERPLLLWADDHVALRSLVDQVLVAQLAAATGFDPDDWGR